MNRKRPKEEWDAWAFLGPKIRRRRRRLELSLAELAGQVGIDPSTLWRIEMSKRLPSLPNAYALAVALDLTLDQFCDG